MYSGKRISRRTVAIGLFTSAMASRATGETSPRTVIVKMNASAFLPAIIKIKFGDTVRWINPDIMPHTVTFDPALAKVKGLVTLPGGVAPFESATLEQDGEFSHTFQKRGTYDYVCRFHQRTVMVGKVIVG